jgi:DNA-3-methyladenine glycosylase I
VTDPLAKVCALRADIKKRFHFLGPITSLHYLMEVGYNLVKPDRVIDRIFSRLHLVEGLPNPDNPDPALLTGEQRCQIVQVGQRIADATKRPIRYVDLVFVVYGQVKAKNPEDLPQGICLDEKPRCNLCGITDYCRYGSKTLSAIS